MTMPVCLLLALMATSVNAFVPMTPVLAARTGAGLRAASSRPVRAQTTAMVLKPEYLEGTGGPPAAGQGEWGTPQPAPSFDLPSDSGASVSLESLAGKWLVLYFYPKADSQGCTLQAQNYQADIEGLHAFM
jgi:cytochrome oxidase Cu insertion factor (SCO1/SenC/PrrC family)